MPCLWVGIVDGQFRVMNQRLEMHPLQKRLFSGPSLRAPRGARGVLCAWHRSLLHRDERGASEGRNASASTLLNGVTPCVSPMMFSRHPRAMLSNGSSPTSVPSASALGCFAQATSTTSGTGPVSSRCFATKGRVGWLSKLTKNQPPHPQDAGLDPVVNPPYWASETAVSLNLTIPFLGLSEFIHIRCVQK